MPKELDRMIARAGGGHSLWEQSEVDLSYVARKARLEHAAEVLLELGYDHLASDLFRLEREGERMRVSTIEPAA
ncbi:MAG: hypothetical protein WEE89_08040 [Gemmatimonadota bacterium]